jgi:hypothetical protein
MPGKMARSGCSTAVRGAWNGGSGRHRAPVLLERRKSVNIHANSGFIWGMLDRQSRLLSR